MTDAGRIRELEERNRLLTDVALSAIALKLQIEFGLTPLNLTALDRDLAAFERHAMNALEKCDVREATHVKYKGMVERIANTWGITEKHLAKPSAGGFGVVTATGRRVGMWEAEAYLRERS